MKKKLIMTISVIFLFTLQIFAQSNSGSDYINLCNCVQFVDFHATYSNCAVNIYLHITNQPPNSYISIQRACDATPLDFIEIGKLGDYSSGCLSINGIVQTPCQTASGTAANVRWPQTGTFTDYPQSNCSSGIFLYQAVYVFEGQPIYSSYFQVPNGNGRATITFPNNNCNNSAPPTNPCPTSPAPFISGPTKISFCDVDKNLNSLPFLTVGNALPQTTIWTSSNPGIVDVDQYGYLLPLSFGTAIISANLGYCNQSCSTTVTVGTCPDSCASSLFLNGKTLYDDNNTTTTLYPIPAGSIKAGSIYVGNVSSVNPSSSNLISNVANQTTNLIANTLIDVSNNFDAKVTGSGYFSINIQSCSSGSRLINSTQHFSNGTNNQYITNAANNHWNYPKICANKTSGTNNIENYNVQNGMINIYPNPSKGNINVELPANMNGNWKVIVCDLFGKTISEKFIVSNENKFALNINSSSGIYFIKLINSLNGYQEIKRVILQK